MKRHQPSYRDDPERPGYVLPSQVCIACGATRLKPLRRYNSGKSRPPGKWYIPDPNKIGFWKHQPYCEVKP